MQKLLLFLLLSLCVFSAAAQNPAPSPAGQVLSGIRANLASGEVSTVNQAENKISLQTSDGAIDVVISSATVFKRVPPEKPTLSAAVDSSISEIGEKDKILVTGNVSADKKTIPAKTIYLMSKSDIAKRLQAERELWRTRGISGKVTKVDFKTQEITLTTRGAMGVETNVVLTPKENAEYLRYAPDSIKFADAVSSNLAEIKAGDQLRALGDKGADGLTFKAERYISGSFRTVAGKITAIDVAKNEITIENAQDKKPTVIVVKENTILKKFPAEMAQMMAGMPAGGMMSGGGAPGGTTMIVRPPGGQSGGQGSNQTVSGGQPPQGAGGNRGEGGGQRQFGRGRGELDDILERLPSLKLAELKVGDAIGIATTTGNIPNRFTAIKLIAGIEPFMTMPQMNMGGGRGGNSSPSINIPGLDGGIGVP